MKKLNDDTNDIKGIKKENTQPFVLCKKRYDSGDKPRIEAMVLLYGLRRDHAVKHMSIVALNHQENQSRNTEIHP